MLYNKIEIKNDCFAYNNIKAECDALKELYCKNEKCKFYKNKKQFDEFKR